MPVHNMAGYGIISSLLAECGENKNSRVLETLLFFLLYEKKERKVC